MSNRFRDIICGNRLIFQKICVSLQHEDKNRLEKSTCLPACHRVTWLVIEFVVAYAFGFAPHDLGCLVVAFRG